MRLRPVLPPGNGSFETGFKVAGAASSTLTVSSTASQSPVLIKALSTNAGIVYVGGAGALPTAATGFPLSANDEIEIPAGDLVMISVMSVPAGQEVRFIYSPA